jgi:hypothetical protein
MGPKRNIERSIGGLMKTTLITALVAATSLSMVAADQQQATTTAQQTTTAPQPSDSPLVRAAKAKSTRKSKSKSKMVITNDNLLKSGGHLTTTKEQPPLPALPKADPAVEKAAQEKQLKAIADEAAAKARKEEEGKKKRALERANATYEGNDPAGIYEDPAVTERRMQQQSGGQPSQPQPMQVQKPPM